VGERVGEERKETETRRRTENYDKEDTKVRKQTRKNKQSFVVYFVMAMAMDVVMQCYALAHSHFQTVAPETYAE
jgi:hypothetical protein